MVALNILLLALAQSPVSTPAQNAVPMPVRGADVNVIGPQPRVICRTIIPSGSHIVSRRICRTAAQAEAETDRNQRDAENTVEAAIRRSNEMLYRSGPLVSGPGESHLPN